MQEVLKKLYGEAVTEESLAKFHEELGKRFVAKGDFNQKCEELKALREQLAQQETLLSEAEQAVAEKATLQQALEDAEAKHAEEMAAFAAQEAQKQFRAALKRELTAVGAKSLPAVQALLDMERITLVDGVLQGLDEQLWELKETNNYLFEEKENALQFIRPAAKNKTEVTEADFQKMGYMERLKMKREQPELYQTMIQTNRR